MALPPEVSRALLRFGVPAETIAWTHDLYRHLGPAVVDALSELVESCGIRPTELRPEHLDLIRPILGERYLRAHHAGWLIGVSSPGFWCDRSVEATAHGIVAPLGDFASSSTRLVTRVAQAACAAGEASPRGLLLVSQNAHRGNQQGTFAFDLVPTEVHDALALNRALGRHHTLPGSVGETSGRALPEPALAIVWEVQPNAWKPGGGRNQAAGGAYRRHRAWPLLTAMSALLWLLEKGYRVFVLKGEALRAAHEVNPAEPLSPEIARLHDRTLERAVIGLGLQLVDGTAAPGELSALAKLNLGRAIEQRGIGALVREVKP